MTFREAAVRVALSQVGVTESPPGSNWGPEVSRYLKSAGWNSPAPWCQAFLNYCFRQVGLDLEHTGEASVGFFEDWARKKGWLVKRPFRGDVVCFNYTADNWPDHVGFVVRVLSLRGFGIVRTVEGNTSLSSDDNGGRVMVRTRSFHRCRFVRIPGRVRDQVKPREYVLRERNGIFFTEPKGTV